MGGEGGAGRSVQVGWLDHPDDERWPGFGALLTRFWQEAIPGDRGVPLGEYQAGCTSAPRHRRVQPLVAGESGKTVGAATLVVDDMRATTAAIPFLYVAPERRRAGVGTLLLQTARARARDEGRSRLRTSTIAASPGATAFAAAAGGRAGLVLEQSRCPVSALDPQELAAWVSRARERAGDYSLVAFDGVCPDDLIDAFAAVIPVMNTAPRELGTDDLTPSPDEVREQMAAHIRQGNESWTVCARHDPTGTFVGYTELSLSSHRPWHVSQGDTGVDPAHRQRGLGRWLKAHTALRLLAEHPEAEHIETWNASANAAMLAINRAMGFRPVARWQEWELPV